MRDEIRDAIEAACNPLGEHSFAQPRRYQSFATVHYTVLRVLREISEEMSVGELRDELEISNNQRPAPPAHRNEA